MSQPNVARRVLEWAFGAWSPTAVKLGLPPYYSFRGALRGKLDARQPPRWALDEDSPDFSKAHIPLADWQAARLRERETDTHPCDHWWFENCVCKGACSCHWRKEDES